MLRWILRLVFYAPFAFGLALFWATQYGGETVELETVDDRGTSFFTTLWVVDLHEQPWLRAGDPEAAWLQRLERDPEVFLVRDGERVAYRAEIEAGSAERVNAAMREKYGRADQVVAVLHDPARVVAIRLVGKSAFDE
ncbi:MAG: hypothetical protein R3F21_19715 [Myxococcota bacterium]